MLLLTIAACVPLHNSTIPDVAEGDSGSDDTGTATTVVEHCGDITADQSWSASRAHHVTCDVAVLSATLTIEAGATVEFDEGTILSVGTSDAESSLVVDGSTNGVVFVPAGDAAWGGIVIGDTARNVSLAGLAMKTTSAGVTIAGAEVTLSGLAIDGVSEGCGLTLAEGATLATGSAGLSITNAATWSVCAEVSTADSIPAAASSYTGNANDGAYLTGNSISTSESWENIWVPYVIAETVDVGGSAGAPAVLTLGEGVSVLVERDRTLRFSRTGDASQLVALGTATAPIVIDSLGADNAGFWKGIEVGRGADAVTLSYVTLRGGGGGGSALQVEDTALAIDHLAVELSGGIGVELQGTAGFSVGSSNLSVTTSEDVPLLLAAASVPSIPLAGLALTGNVTDAVQVGGTSAVSESGTWFDVGVPYWITDDIDVDGTAALPAVLSLEEGVNLLFDNDRGLYVGKTGAAGLLVAGSEAAPVTFLPWSANSPGAWSGIAVYDNAVDSSVNLANAEVGYAGGSTLKGNLHVVDASPTFTNVALHDGLEWGLYLSGASVPILSGVTYADNGAGTCNACE